MDTVPERGPIGGPVDLPVDPNMIEAAADAHIGDIEGAVAIFERVHD
jgi:hypothetical protein